MKKKKKNLTKKYIKMEKEKKVKKQEKKDRK